MNPLPPGPWTPLSATKKDHWCVSCGKQFRRFSRRAALRCYVNLDLKYVGPCCGHRVALSGEKRSAS